MRERNSLKFQRKLIRPIYIQSVAAIVKWIRILFYTYIYILMITSSSFVWQYSSYYLMYELIDCETATQVTQKSNKHCIFIMNKIVNQPIQRRFFFESDNSFRENVCLWYVAWYDSLKYFMHIAAPTSPSIRSSQKNDSMPPDEVNHSLGQSIDYYWVLI